MAKSEFTPKEMSYFHELRSLYAAPAEQLIQMRMPALALGAGMFEASIGTALARAEEKGELKPAVPKSRVYVAGELRSWMTREMTASGVRFGKAFIANPANSLADPGAAVRQFQKDILASFQ